MPYVQLLPHLLEFQLVKLRTLLLSTNSLPDDDDARCESHAGAPGHDVDNCKAVKYRICPMQGHVLFTPDGLNRQDIPFLNCGKESGTSHSQGCTPCPGSPPLQPILLEFPFQPPMRVSQTNPNGSAC